MKYPTVKTTYSNSKGLSIAKVMILAEGLDEKTLLNKLDHIWDCMKESIERGMLASGLLPGGLKVKRRALELHDKLKKEK